MRTSLAFVVAAVLGACAGGSNDPAPTPDANNNTPVCGDGTCAAAEVGVCAQDCGSSAAQCGNLQCENGESAQSCPSDCSGGGPVCGDSQCDMAGGENSTNCPGDCGGTSGGQCPADPTECLFCLFDPSFCPPGLDEATCTECALGGGGGGLSLCEGGAPDGTCNAAAGEDNTTCPQDCP